jgi:hypothetical protein
MAGLSDVRRAPLMGPNRLLRWAFWLSVLGAVAVVTVQIALMVVVARPAGFFTHADGNGAITFHAEGEIPPGAHVLADEVMALLAAGPMGAPEMPVDIWLVEDGWPLRLFFAGSPTASGLTYPVASTRNVFLRHADLSVNRLVRDGFAIPPPRTLSYFLVHEITHLQVAQHVGRWRIVRMPRWVNEGFADYVALGPASPHMIAAVEVGVDLARQQFGTYPRERACVTLALAQLPSPQALFDLEVGIAARAGLPVCPRNGHCPGATAALGSPMSEGGSQDAVWQAYSSDHRRRHRGLQIARSDPAVAGPGAQVTPVLDPGRRGIRHAAVGRRLGRGEGVPRSLRSHR